MAGSIFLLALALRLIHLWQIRTATFFTVLVGDGRGYDTWAQQIAAGDWIGREVFYQAPLYPYFLGVLYASFGHDLLVVRVVQAVLGSAACVLLALAASRLFSRRTGVIAGGMLALYAPAIFFDGIIQKSVLDLFFLCLSLWLVSRLVEHPRRVGLWLGLGVAMGALSLTRENALVFIAVLLGWSLLGVPAPWMARMRQASVFVLGLALVLVPVAARNDSVGGGFFVTTSQFGPNFYIGNNPRADGTYASLRFGRGAPEYERQDATELAELAAGRRLTPGEVSSYWTDRALGFIVSEPGRWLSLVGRKFALLWNATEMLDTESQETYAERSVVLRVLGWVGHFGALVPLALLGLWATWPDRRRLVILYLMLGMYAASVLLFYVFARYRLPLVPFLVVFAAAGLGHAWQAGRAWLAGRAGAAGGAGGDVVGRRLPVALAAGLVVAVVGTNWPMLSRPLMQAITENNLGTALHDLGRFDEAIAHYRRAVEMRADYAPAFSNMGVALRASGDLPGAVAAYEQGLGVQPDYPDLHYNLANALLEQGRSDEAADHFRIALRAIPASASARNNLGIALAAQGQLAAATREFEEALRVDPDSATAHRNLGDVLSSQGRMDEALPHLRRAVELTPNDGPARYDLAVVLLEAGRATEAETQLRAALTLIPPSADAHNNLGIALGSQGRLQEALAQFERALAIDPSSADARQNLQRAREALSAAR